jgi:hypothetical protein
MPALAGVDVMNNCGNHLAFIFDHLFLIFSAKISGKNISTNALLICMFRIIASALGTKFHGFESPTGVNVHCSDVGFINFHLVWCCVISEKYVETF